MIKILSENLRKLRINAGYTQDKVSQLLNIQRAAYCNYENGTRTPPIETIIALAELYHVSVDYLIRGLDTCPCTGVFSRKILMETNSLPAVHQQEVLNFILFRKLLLSNQLPSEY